MPYVFTSLVFLSGIVMGYFCPLRRKATAFTMSGKFNGQLPHPGAQVKVTAYVNAAKVVNDRIYVSYSIPTGENLNVNMEWSK